VEQPPEYITVNSTWDNKRLSLSRSFVRDLEGLWAEVLKLAAVAEDALNQGIHALCSSHGKLGETLICPKRSIDKWEAQIEHECLRVLALHQPVASDLRRVATVLKINGDLERLCNLAQHIAKRVKKLARDPDAFPIPQALEDLALTALSQIHESLDALTQYNIERAQEVMEANQQLNNGYRAVQVQLKLKIIRNPERINTWLRLFNTARNLKRVANHAVKIAESVIFLEEGPVLRHYPIHILAKGSIADARNSGSSPISISN
jgi:phosphate transport system protein